MNWIVVRPAKKFRNLVRPAQAWGPMTEAEADAFVEKHNPEPVDRTWFILPLEPPENGVDTSVHYEA